MEPAFGFRYSRAFSVSIERELTEELLSGGGRAVGTHPPRGEVQGAQQSAGGWQILTVIGFLNQASLRTKERRETSR